jgi:hypothetical protein
MTTPARLCPIVEGVLFDLSGGRGLRGLIVRDALEGVFEATSEPRSWLRAFHQHDQQIVHMALRLHRISPDEILVLLRWRHFQEPPREAGPAQESAGRTVPHAA